MYKGTNNNVKELPIPIITVEVNDIEMEDLKVLYLINLDLKPYVVCNIQDINNKSYYQWNGSDWINLNTKISQGSLIKEILTVPTLTSDVNDWNPTGFNKKTDLIRVDVDFNNREITGIVKPDLGINRILGIKNINALNSDLRFSNNDAGSLPQNRFLCSDGNSKSIKANEMALWFYDHIIQRWTPFNKIG